MRSAINLTALVFVTFVALTGCERPDDPMLTVMESTASQTRVNDLARTMDYVFSERQYIQTEFSNSVSAGLNRWGGYSQKSFEDIEWTPDESVNELLKSYQSIPVVERIDGTSFLSADGKFLQSRAWLNFVAKRVEKDAYLGQYELYRLMADDYKPSDDEEAPVDAVFAALNPDLSKPHAKQLALAVRLFDWVTRNVQLEEVPQYTEDEIEELRLVEADSLAASGLAAPGTKRGIWELLLFARGDYIEKAKLFMALCHQVDLPAVMLATGEDKTPWAVGVLIGDEYFLFDTKLGLPVPGKDDISVATLSAVTADPTILSNLDLTIKESLADDTKYWGTDLDNMTGLVYWEPQSVSRRITVLETSLSSDQKLALVQRPSEIIAKLPAVENLKYEPWENGLQTVQFRQILAESLPKSISDDVMAQKLRWYFPEEGYIIRFTNYRTSRSRFLRGKFERPQDFRVSRKRDAIESFAMLMYEDETISGLKTDTNLQAMIGIRKKGQTEAEYERQITSRQNQMRLVRRDSGLFMCQSHFDNGSVSTAANWVPKLLAEQDVERWEGALRYLNGRSIEARHQYDEAIEQYQAEGPQQHGNLIRARLLKKQIETQYAKKKDSQN